jgi:type IV pilus assembly protein PilM
VLGNDRILALNVGASKLVLAEFAVRTGRAPVLLNYGIGELGVAPDNETDASPYIVVALRDLLRATGIKPAPLLLALSGQAVFPRFVKLPPVGRDRLAEMIRYEAEQNVPFPIGEVVWDYQVIGSAAEGEQHAMIVAVKTENITEITDCVTAAGLDPEIVDVAPLALYNCARYNYPDLPGCAMVLDIGARSTNLVFLEQGRVFSRTIPVAGNAITQEIAKSFQIGFAEAETLKRQHAFVALGGVFSSGDDETADRISKIVRNVVTRLHAEISRSINFYRSQQGGSAPARVLLTGGSSRVPHMDTFFREKLQVEVETLNPFVNAVVGGSLDAQRVAADVSALGEVVGLALRRSLACPVEINLTPPVLLDKRTFRRRVPFLALAAAGVLLMLGVWTLFAKRTLKLYESQQTYVQERLERLSKDEKKLQTAQKERADAQGRADDLRRLIGRRTAWIRILNAAQDSLLDGMWLAGFEPLRDASGRLAKVRLTGYGFNDKEEAVRLQKDVEAAGGKMTAVEILRDRLTKNPVFGGEVKINNDRDSTQSVREFDIEAAVASPEG